MLKKQLREIIEKHDSSIAILIKDLKTNEILFNYNENKIYPAASLIKIPIAIEALKKADELEIPLLTKIEIKDSDKVDFSVINEQNLKECTYLELITWMIISSDNTATNILIDVLGMDNINATIKSLGMKNTRLQRKMMDFCAIGENKNNFTCLEDTMILMEELYNGEAINKEISKKLIDIMKNQRDNTMLKRYISNNVLLANKTGILDNQKCDIGIFYTKLTDYFIGIFVDEVDTENKSYKAIGTISKIVYEHFMHNPQEKLPHIYL